MKTIEAGKTEEKNVIRKAIDQDQGKSAADIRAAIVAPDRTQSIPGYFLILGKLKEGNTDGDMPELIFLTELEEASQEVLFEKLVKNEEKFRFNTIYIEPYKTELGCLPPDFIRSLHIYVNKHTPWVRIASASFLYADDIKQGVHLLDQWKGKNEIPKGTILQDQLVKIGPKNFEDPTFYAFTALRYLLAGFKLDKNSFIEEVKKRRPKAKKADARKNLDSASRAASDEYDIIMKQIKEEDEGEDDF